MILAPICVHSRLTQLMSNHPSVSMGGGWEIRPAEDISEQIAESERRIKKSKGE